jgi:alkylation response protein AidB-like acyl-CoA dehydrogenase
MDVRLSPEQQALRDAAAQVVDRLGPKAVGRLDDAERAGKLDAAVAASGWRELRTAEAGEGPLASGVEAAIVAEELGRGLADTAYVGPTLAADLRRLAGAPPATVAETVALAPGLGEAACVARDAIPAGRVAVDAAGAVTALVLLPAPDGHVLGEVRLQPVDELVDLTRPTAVPAPAPVAALADRHRPLTDDDLTRWTALGLALTSADLVGVMRGAIDLACAYAAERRQYGAPIGSFQAVQHLLADAFVAMEGSRSATLHAAWAVDTLPVDEALAAGAVAKAYCARAARSVCETVIQVHGGIGNTWECLAHVYLRRALLSSDVLGGTGVNVARVLAHHGITYDRIGSHDGLR